ncbi:MAG TPA: hypothetical protein V6D12_01850 [Candidatus Obscuribacterales bacterium]
MMSAPKHKFNYKRVFNLPLLSKGLILATAVFLVSSPTVAQDAPTKQYGQGKNTPLVWILAEWNGKHPQAPLYLCTCTKSECDNSKSWPFRRYSLAGVMPVLGDFNRSSAENKGFSCGQVSPKELQGIGG